MSIALVVAGVLLSFGAVSALLGLWMLPSSRDAAGGFAGRLFGGRAARPGVDRVAGVGSAERSDGARRPAPAGALHDGSSGATFARQALVAAAAAGVVAAGPAVAVLAGDRLSGHGAPVWHDERIAAALAAPAPAAAPATESSPHTSTPALAESGDAAAARDWSRLDPRFRERLLAVFDIARERHGYELVLLEGWRSPERQAELAAQGPERTLAGPQRSRHQAGLAADVAFRRDGRLVVSERDAWAAQAYRHYGEIARSLGLEWGGDWSSLKDLGHVEWRMTGRERADDAPTPRLVASE